MRSVFDGTRAEPAWVLDHDYLCAVVAEGALLADRRRVQLKMLYDKYRSVPFPARLLYLAPVLLQSALAVLWLRRKFRYHELASYAGLSLLRISPVLIVLLAFVALRYHYQADKYRALLTSWHLPPDLYDVQSQLKGLTIPASVTQLDWLDKNVVRLRIAAGTRPSSGEAASPDERLLWRPLSASLEALDISGFPYSVKKLDYLPRRNLRYLNVNDNGQLYSLDGLPPHVTHLSAVSNGLKFFSFASSTLVCLELGSSQFKSFDQLPAELPSLSALRLAGTSVASLKGLPGALRSLDLAGNIRLSVVDYLPPLVEALGIDLARIPPGMMFPRYLKDLHLSRVQLEDFSGLPDGLTALTLSSVDVKAWEKLPRSLRSLTLIHVPLPSILPASVDSLALVLPERDVPFDRLPPKLSTLRLSLVPIKDLAAIPKDVVELAINNTILPSLAGCPSRLRRLDLRGTRQLRLVSEVPPGLVSLNLMSSIELERIENLPAGLRFLNIAGTHIARLPKLPEGMEELDISGSKIESLTGLPAGLRRLTVGVGQLRSLRGIPRTVEELRFLESPEDRAERTSHFSCDPSPPPFEYWPCLSPR